MISEIGINIAQDQVQTSFEYEYSKTQKKFQTFIRFSNFYYYFIKESSKLAKTLIDFMSK
jgi:hypothetical protein